MASQVVKVKRETVEACMTCPLCNKLLKEATTISLCLHTCEYLWSVCVLGLNLFNFWSGFVLVLHICDLGSSCFVSILEISGGGNGVFLFLISDLHIMDFALSTSSLCGCGYLWILQLHNCNFKSLTCGFFNCVLILFTLFPKKKKSWFDSGYSCIAICELYLSYRYCCLFVYFLCLASLDFLNNWYTYWLKS